MEPSLHLQNNKAYFSRNELLELFASVLVLAFIASFGMWGEGERVFVDGFPNFLQALHLIFVLVLFNTLVKKWYGRKLGYEVKYEYAPFMLFIGVLVAMLSGGSIPFLIMGYMSYTVVPRLRLKTKQGGYRHTDIAKIVVAGLIFNLLFALAGKALYSMTGLEYFLDFIGTSLWLTLFVMIPFELIQIWKLRYSESVGITPSDGLHILYCSRGLYVYVLAVLAFFFALLLAPGFWGVLVAPILGYVCYVLFRKYLEVDAHSW